MDTTHLYIHIPFCRSKCLYCDFYSRVRVEVPWERWLTALEAEAVGRRGELSAPPATIYVGGGTPSLMPAEIAVRLCEGMRRIFGASPREVTIELNPDDVTPEYAGALMRAGYNRFSMGVQSFHDNSLRLMGRRHTAAQAVRAFEVLRSAGNVSLDLIFGLPGQTFEQWRADVAQTIALRPQHVSCYSLMLEEDTPLTRLVDSGRIDVPADDVSEAMYRHLCDALAAAGYRHYEISNFALPGYESAHNSAYWRSHPYLGLGAGAHSYDGASRRSCNPPDIEGYMRRYADGTGTYAPEQEMLTPQQLRHEYVMTRLRTARGISLRRYAALFGEEAAEALAATVAAMLRDGRLAATADGRVRIPEDRWLAADPIIVDLL